MKEDGEKREGKQEATKTGRSVKWVGKKSKMVCKLTELINNPLKEQMLAKKNLSPKDLS